jgi:hypothetical protein
VGCGPRTRHRAGCWPGHTRGVAVAASAVALGFGLVARRGDEAAELPHRHLVLPHVKSPADLHPVHRAFVCQQGEALGLQQGKTPGQCGRGVRAAHPEVTRRNQDKGHADAVAPGGRRCQRRNAAGAAHQRQCDETLVHSASPPKIRKNKRYAVRPRWHLWGSSGASFMVTTQGSCPVLLPLPLGEGWGEGPQASAHNSAMHRPPALTPALSQRERESNRVKPPEQLPVH